MKINYKAMKKYIAIAIILLAACQPDPPNDLLRVQTGPGWGSIRYKVNFRDTVNLTTGWMLHDTIITPGAKQFNYLHGLTSNVQAQINGLVPYTGATGHVDIGGNSLFLYGSLASQLAPIAGAYITDAWVSELHVATSADVVNGAFTNSSLLGTTNVSKLQVGNYLSATKAIIDSTVKYGGKLYDFIGSDTVPRGLLASERVSLSSVIGLYTTSWDSTYIHRRVDALAIQVTNLELENAALWTALNLLAGATDVQPPLFLSAEVGTFADNVVVMTMNAGDVHQGLIPPTSAFEVTRDGTVVGLTSVTITNNKVYITLTANATAGATYFLDYTGAVTFLQDSSANKTPNFVNKTVTNNVGFTAEYQVIWNAFLFKPETAIAAAQDELVDSLTTYGGNYLNRMDVLIVPATSYNNGGEALMWWNDITKSAVNNSSTAWTTLRGFQGDGLADYISAFYNPTTDSVNFGKNDGSIFTFLLDDVTEDDAYVFGSYQAGVGTIGLRPKKTGNLAAAWMNATTSIDNTGGITNSSGWFLVTRTLPSGTGATKIYHDETTVDSETDASTGVPNTAITILRRNGAASYSYNEFAVFGIMDGVSDAENAQLKRFFKAYLVRIGTVAL